MSKTNNDLIKIGEKENIYLEYWKTDILGYYDNCYIGLMID